MNQAPPKYEAGMLNYELWRSGSHYKRLFNLLNKESLPVSI
jgi:hypothetical protein